MSHSTEDAEVYLENVFGQVAKNLKYKDNEGKDQTGGVPLLVIEIESRTTEDNLLRTVFTAVKGLVADRAAANAIIVLSDALSAKDLTPGLVKNSNANLRSLRSDASRVLLGRRSD